MLKDEEAYPLEYNTYKLGDVGGIKEVAIGAVGIDKVVDAISSEESWGDLRRGDWYNYSEIDSIYGPTNLIDRIIYPDGTEEGVSEEELDLSKLSECDYIKEGGEPVGESLFFQVAESYEKGSWNWDEFELEYEFTPSNLQPQYAELDDIVSGYIYRLENEDVDIEGALESSRTSGTDITLYANTELGLEIVYTDDLLSELEEVDIDTKDKDAIKKFILNKYGPE